jgi:pimeloyl-ACP methyl ester carboxylesterase
MPIRAIYPAGQLALQTYGAGVPVVFLHGLTFDRRSWRPIIDRLGSGVRSTRSTCPVTETVPVREGDSNSLPS